MLFNDFLATMAARRSVSAVDGTSPSDAELAKLLTAVVPVADHKGLTPWRLVVHRGAERLQLAEALAQAKTTYKAGPEAPVEESALASAAWKVLRAPLLIAIIATPHGHKVPDWEQEAVAHGAAHLLSLALFAAGWGAMWRSGEATSSAPVRALYALAERDRHAGWLYVGGVEPRYAERIRTQAKKRPAPDQFLCTLTQLRAGSAEGQPSNQE